ncbi:MAG: hypothetical protein KIT25_04080 [Enhydrobacter sp.]|nr:MAG: hypothetical protein KIT25_04080 [Enhydrobacter sp.]
MFNLAFDRRTRLMLVRFGGALSLDDLARLDERGPRLAALLAPAGVIHDFTAIERLDVTAAQMATRAQQQQFCSRLPRAVVAPQPAIFGLMRLYGTYQSAAGHTAPVMARTMDEAAAILGLPPPAFTTIANSWTPVDERRVAVASAA